MIYTNFSTLTLLWNLLKKSYKTNLLCLWGCDFLHYFQWRYFLGLLTLDTPPFMIILLDQLRGLDIRVERFVCAFGLQYDNNDYFWKGKLWGNMGIFVFSFHKYNHIQWLNVCAKKVQRWFITLLYMIFLAFEVVNGPTFCT